MVKDTYQRRIWDTFRVREWPDADTASLYAYSIRSVPISEEGEETSQNEMGSEPSIDTPQLAALVKPI